MQSNNWYARQTKREYFDKYTMSYELRQLKKLYNTY